MSKPLRWVLAIAILLAVILWVEIDIGWSSVFLAWRDVPPTTLLGLILLTLVSYVLRAYRVYLYFGHDERHPFSSYIRISFLHNALNNLLPMRLGEASFPLLMRRTFGYPLLKTGAGLLWIRLMDLHWLLLTLSVIAAIQLGSYLLVITAGLVIAPWLSLLLIRRGILSDRLPTGIVNKLVLLRSYSPGDVRFAALIYALTAVVWIIKLAALTVIMLSFIDIPGTEGLFAVISADLSSVLPIHGLAGSGTFEGAMLAALLPLGVDRDAVLLAAVNVHLYLLFVTLLSVPMAMLIPNRIANAEVEPS